MSDNERDHRGQPPTTHTHHHPPPEHEPGFGDVFVDHRPTAIKHVFVLMLENRSFDHMLGFSGITGTDAATGKPTTIAGLTGAESNSHGGHTYRVSQGAPDVGEHGPAHGFNDVLEQLCGAGATYPRGGHYPPITSSGYASSYAKRAGAGSAGDVMRCFTPAQLPVLDALAREFVVCDHWFSSMPGPTWPNRMFAHAASAGGFDDGPSPAQEVAWSVLPESGVRFSGGNIFSALAAKGVKYRIYADDPFPNVSELENISILRDVREFEDLAEDLRRPGFDAGYVFIEPSYDVLGDYRDGNSQHPLGSVAAGEQLIKATYEAIRNSPVWDHSLLIITWDEHGGFYDHVAPGPALRPGAAGRTHGFTFEQLGPRVPAVIVSPLIPRNLIEHRPYEHASIPATVERVFGLHGLNSRDGRCNGANHLATLATARADTPRTLPAVATPQPRKPAFGARPPARPDEALAADPDRGVEMVLRAAMHQELQLASPAERDAIRARVGAIKTRAQAMHYLEEVHARIRTRRVHAGVARVTVG